MLTAVVFLLILTSAVLVHELAHFTNARSVGVPVRAFSIGMGPVVWRRRWRGTEWRVALLPIGGYVDLPGMAPKVDADGNLQHPDEGMAHKGIGAKLWVLFGGILANFLLGIVLLTAAVLLQPGYRELIAGTQVAHGSSVAHVVDGSRAQALGIREGDRILAINGIENPAPADVVDAVRHADHLTLTIGSGAADTAPRTVRTPWPPPGAGDTPLLGVSLEPVSIDRAGLGTALAEAAWFGVRVVPDMVRGFVRGFAGAVSGSGSDEVAGPVGMVSLVNQATRVGLGPVIFLAAIINFSLAVFNLLPIPGLDGGRMLLAGIVALRGKPFKPGQEEQIHFLGIMAVLALIVLVTVQELGGLIRG